VKSIDVRLKELCSTLTLEEKVSLLTGRDFWSTQGIERIGLRPVVFSDGPSGIRGQAWDERDPSTNLPSSTALSASWDRTIARRYGQVLADEAQRKGVDVVLGPTINMHRTPTGGRHFEAFSEDPLLTGDLAAAYVDGIQELGIGATPKHYLCNDFETERYTVDVRVDERTLREIYLTAFEKSVTEAHAWLVMSSYNAINGATASENQLLESPLNDEWDFDGVMIGDWTGVRSLESARFSQDLAMPGPDGPWGQALVDAVESGWIDEALIDRKVLRILGLAARCGAIESIQPDHPRRLSGVDAAGFARRAAVAGSVLLTNTGVLPIDPTTPRRIAVVGHSARTPRTQGGGSATVVPHHVVTPLDGIREAFPDATIDYLPGVLVENSLTELPASALTNPVTGERGARVQFLDVDRSEIHVEDRRASKLVWFGGDAPIERTAELRIATTFVPDTTGTISLGIATVGRVVLEVDGEVVLDTVIEPIGTDLGAALLAPPAAAVSLDVTSGTPLEMRIVHTPRRGGEGLQNALGITIGLLPLDIDDDVLIADAAAAARESDLVIVVVGSNKELEAEGADRETLSLPGRQDDLVRAVAATGTDVVVVVNCGAPVLLPWADEVAAVLQVWFGGQEMGGALGDMLVGVSEPGGRLPTTWPAREEDVPVLHVVPVDGVVEYSEGIHVGYRGWLRGGVTPAWPFGHGLGYTSWEFTDLVAESPVSADADSTTVTVTVRNTGDRRGKTVVQVYASRSDSAVDRPVRWLAGFATVEIDAGTSTDVPVSVDARAFAHFDRDWRWEPGEFTLQAGTSSAHLPLRTTVAVRP
jgi:beta-glucosidase